jgi:ACS family tartrate transporter-like MFS transporter
MPLSQSPSDDLSSAIGKARRRLIPFLFLLYIVAYLDRVNVGFAALQMNEALGLSARAYASGAGIFFASYVIFEIPSNVLMARVGARLWIARIMVSWGLVSAAMMFVRGAGGFFAMRFLLGAAEAGFFPGIIFFLTRWFPARERARTVAAFMTAVLSAGILGGPISGALLTMNGVLGLAGWQWLFLLEGLPAVSLGVIVFFVLAERPEDARWLTTGERAALTTRLMEEACQQGDRPGTLAATLANGRIWLLAAVYFSLPVALYAVSFWLPQILKSASGSGDFTVGLLSAIPYLFGALGMVVTGRHSDRTGERRWHTAIACVVGGAAFAASAYVSALVPSLVLLSIAMTGMASMCGPFWTLATTAVSGTGAAAGIALINSVGNIGGFVGPYILGYVRDTTGSLTGGLVGIGAILAAGGVLVLMAEDHS